MTDPRSWPGKQRFPVISGRVMVDSTRGVPRIRKWPEKRGTPKSAQVRLQNERFRIANDYAKRTDGFIIAAAMEATKSSGLYPRDLMVRAILKGLYDMEFPDGSVISYGRAQLEPVVFQGFELRLVNNAVITGGQLNYFTWPVPIKDTAAFWDAAQPDRITIPQGVTMMSFYGGWRRSTLVGSFLIAQILNITAGNVTVADLAQNDGGGGEVSTGPISVTPGDQYGFSVFPSVGATALGPRTFFGGRIEEATT